MKPEGWYMALGALLIMVTLIGTWIKRLPVTSTILYLAAGAALGPALLNAARLDAFANANLLERLAELGVLVSLFTAGLKLRASFREPKWRIAIRLAFVSMVLTVGLVTLGGIYVLGLPLGAAVLLGAVLAPTDPVLASDVQLQNAADRDRLRFSITGEAGLNDGTAFPFVMLGLGLLGLHELGPLGMRWFAIDVLWAVCGGLAIGTLCGMAIGKIVLHLRSVHREAVGRDEFALGLIAFSYGAALLAHTYGFLAVFSAGLALRRIEQRASGQSPAPDIRALAEVGRGKEVATHPEHAPAYMAEAALFSNERAERLLEVGLVLLLGLTLQPEWFTLKHLGFALLLFTVIRPIAVWAGLPGLKVPLREKTLLSWFGIRGIGSIYYLMYSVGKGVPEPIAHHLIAATLSIVAVSIVVHGISVTPLMRRPDQ